MKKTLKVTAAVALTSLLLYVLITHREQLQRSAADRDSIAYWAAGRLITEHRNPYDHAQVLDLQRQHGYREDRPLVLRTPPWSLFLVAPLGWLSPFSAWIAWLAVLFGCLVIGVRVTRKLYDATSSHNLFVLVAYTFAPVPACLVSGQMGLILMLGIVLFLYLEPNYPIAAGAALILPFAKPHLLVLFWLGLLGWAVSKRKYRVVLGFLLSLALAILLAIVLNEKVFIDYREMLRGAAIQREFIPAFSGVLRLLFFRQGFWVQFVPMAIGAIWAVIYIFRNLSGWRWQVHGPALLIVSVLTTPYGWLSDEAVLLPAVLQAAALVYAIREHLSMRSKVAIAVFGSLNLLLLLILRFKIPFSTGIYFWSSLVWSSWYFYGVHLHSRLIPRPESREVVPRVKTIGGCDA